DAENLLVRGDRLREPAGKPLDEAEVVPRNAVERELREDGLQVPLGVVEPALVLRDRGAEEGRLAPVGPPALGLDERGSRGREPPLRDLGARPVERAVRLVRGELRDARPGAGRPLQVTLLEEADAVVVPAEPERVGIAAGGA